MYRPCEHCTTNFKVKRIDQRWCSDLCKMENYKLKKRERNALALIENPINSIQCEFCSALITLTTRSNEKQQRFCSRICKSSWHKLESKKATALIRSKMILKCPTCEVNFSPKKNTKEKYCSKYCRCLFPKKCYKALQTCLKYMGEKKKDKSHKLLGYTPKQLQEHIQKHPNWNSIKDGKWHLDHRFPIIAFLKAGIKNISVICCLENLQPLSEKDNCIKNDTYDEKEFKEFLKNHIE